MASSAITAELALEIKGFLEGIKKAQDSAKTFAKNGSRDASGWASGLSGVGKALGAVGAAALTAAAAVGGVVAAAVGGLAVGIKNALDLGGQYSDLAARMDTTAGKARILAAQFEANGMGAEDTATTIDKMQKTLANAANGMGSASKAFDSLGLDADSLVDGDPVTVFNQVIGALRGVSSETERTALSMEIFGRAGGKLGVLMNDPKSLEDATKLIGGQAALLDENASKFDRAADILDQSRSKIQGFFVGVGAKIIDQIMPAIDALESLDLTGIGARFGAALSNALNYAVAIFQTLKGMSLEKVGSLFVSVLKVGFGEAINLLFRGGSAAFSAIIAYFIEGIKNTIALLGILTTSSFWAGMLNAFLGIAQVFAGFLAKRISQIITAIKEATGPVGKKVLGDSDKTFAAQGDALMKSGKEDLAQAGQDLAPTFEKIGERMRATGAAMGDAFKNTFNKATNIVDVSKDKGAVAGIAAEIAKAAQVLRNAPKEGAAPAESPSTPGAVGESLPALNSRLAGAINVISGRSANAIIAGEAAKTSQNTERTAKATEEIAKKIGGGSSPTPQPKPQRAAAGRFA